MRTFRITAVCPLVLAVVAFALNVVLLRAGSRPGAFSDKFIVSLNTSMLGQDIILFEPANLTAPSTSSPSPTSSSSPFNFLNPFAPSNPLSPSNPSNPLAPILGPLVDNATSTIDDVLQNAVNGIVQTLVQHFGVRDFYNLFTQNICEGDIGKPGERMNTTECLSYGDQNEGKKVAVLTVSIVRPTADIFLGENETLRAHLINGCTALNKVTKDLRSSIVIGTTNVSIPLVASLSSSMSSASSTITTIRQTLIGFLIIATTGSGITFALCGPAMLFPESRALVYATLVCSLFASAFQLLAAILLTAITITVTGAVNLLGGPVGLHAKRGAKALSFVWLAWLFIGFAAFYWTAAWFVEVRSWSFVRRRRIGEERGSWKGIRRELRADLKGQGEVAKGLQLS